MIGGCIRFTQLSIMLHMYDTVLYGLVKAINWLCIFASQIVECSLHTRSASTDNLAATLIILFYCFMHHILNQIHQDFQYIVVHMAQLQKDLFALLRCPIRSQRMREARRELDRNLAPLEI